jgi:hypothetical protein
MQTGEISFCGHIGFNIKSDDIKQNILSILHNKYNIKIIDRHYEKYDQAKHSDSKNFVTCLRTNGNPYFLLLTKINNINQCIFIDKKIQNGYVYPRMVIIKFFFDDSLFNDHTLFEGEMIKTQKNDWIFIFNDLLVDCGKSTNKLQLSCRIDRCYNILDNMLLVSVQDICAFQVKRFFEMDERDELENFMNKLDYTCRGIYIVSKQRRQRPILMNFDDSLIVKKVKVLKTETFCDDVAQKNEPICKVSETKHKEVEINREIRHDVVVQRELYIQKTSRTDIYEVYDEEQKKIGIALVNSIKVSKALKSLFLNATPIDKKKFVCVYNKSFDKWCPIIN